MKPKNNKMIEFNGEYKKKGNNLPMPVLIQYDGVLLHVWHISEPFYRLFSSDVFQVNQPFFSKQCIKLPIGGRLETENIEAIRLIENLQNCQTSRNHSLVHRKTRFMVTLTSLLIILSAVLLFASMGRF